MGYKDYLILLKEKFKQILINCNIRKQKQNSEKFVIILDNWRIHTANYVKQLLIHV